MTTFGSGDFGDGNFGGVLYADPPLGWAVDLQTRTGGASVTAAPLSDFRVVWSLDGPGSFEATLSEDDAASWLAGQRRVVVRNDDGPQWGGWLTGLSESTGSYTDLSRPRGTPLRANGLGFASILERRIVHGDFNRFMTVGTTIAWSLIQEAQSQTQGDYGFVLGSVTGTAPARTRHYCDGDVISDAINELAAKQDGGFDWEIDADGATHFWVGGRGGASAETLARTEAMTWNVTYDTTEMATFVTTLGSTDEPCGAPLVIQDNGLQTTFGRVEVANELDSNDSAEMEQHADDELESRLSSRLRLHTTWPEDRAPWAWGDVWLGDTLSVTLPTHFGGTQTMRVIEVALSVEPPTFGFVEYEMETVA